MKNMAKSFVLMLIVVLLSKNVYTPVLAKNEMPIFRIGIELYK